MEEWKTWSDGGAVVLGRMEVKRGKRRSDGGTVSSRRRHIKVLRMTLLRFTLAQISKILTLSR